MTVTGRSPLDCLVSVIQFSGSSVHANSLVSGDDKDFMNRYASFLIQIDELGISDTILMTVTGRSPYNRLSGFGTTISWKVDGLTFIVIPS